MKGELVTRSDDGLTVSSVRWTRFGRPMIIVIATIMLISTMQTHAQPVDLGLSFQTNAVVQFDRATDGTVWAITSSSMDRLPTLAGVYALRSTNNGTSWDTSCISPDWWKWGTDITAVSKSEAWACIMRDDVEDTLLTVRTTDGGRTWKLADVDAMRSGTVHALHFFSDKIGVALGRSGSRMAQRWMITRTTDGGRTWMKVDSIYARIGEVVAERNGRSMSSGPNDLWIGMSSGRIIVITDKGATARDVMCPLGGSVNALCHLTSDSVLAVRTMENGTSKAVTTIDGSTWVPAPLPPSLTNVHGLYRLSDGSLVTVPNEVTKTALLHITADLTSATMVHGPDCFGVLELGTSILITGTELMPGKGLLRLPLR
jgi:hypothetical protein